MISTHVLASFLVGLQSPTPSTPTPAQPTPEVVLTAQHDADVHNFLVMRLRLIKHGAAVEDIKSAIVNDIDFGAVSPKSVDLLKRALSLCDKVIANQAQLGAQLKAEDQQRKEENTKAAGGIAKLLLSGSTGNVMGLLSGLSELDSGNTSAANRAKLLDQSAADIGAEVSSMEFDLAVVRSQVQAAGHLSAQEFVTPADCGAFLNAARQGTEKDRTAGIAKALEASPRLQPAALNLAVHFFEAGDHQNCNRFAELAIASAPRILRRDPLRAGAYAVRARSAAVQKNYPLAISQADSGLQDDPSNTLLLLVKAAATALGGDYQSAFPQFEKLTLLVPDNPDVLYDLACCQAVTSKDADAALKSLKAAIQCGYSDIAHAKQDGGLNLLRTTRRAEFESLTALKLKAQLRQGTDLFNPVDALTITNEGAFTLLDVELRLTFVAGTSGKKAKQPPPATQSIKIQRLAPGAKLTSRDVGAHMHAGLTELQVVAIGEQGRFEKTFARGELQ